MFMTLVFVGGAVSDEIALVDWDQVMTTATLVSPELCGQYCHERQHGVSDNERHCSCDDSCAATGDCCVDHDHDLLSVPHHGSGGDQVECEEVPVSGLLTTATIPMVTQGTVGVNDL